MVEVFCVCGELAPVETITEAEKDTELRTHCLGKTVVVCRKCYTATEVKGMLKKAIDEAELIGGSVSLSDIKEKG